MLQPSYTRNEQINKNELVQDNKRKKHYRCFNDTAEQRQLLLARSSATLVA
jgi:hypothetical protein